MTLDGLTLNTGSSSCDVDSENSEICLYTIPATNDDKINIDIYYNRNVYTVSFDTNG
ncbi:hypothetical protein IJU97_04935 [bacterium]|nr:hypothetical protein [bacterium]